MKFAIVMLMSMLMMGGVAEAKVDRPCTATHGVGFCNVHSQRVAIQAYREKLATQLKRSHRSLHLKPMRNMAWKVGPLHRANLWTRHMFKVAKSYATYIVILHPDDWACLHKYEAGSDWAMAPPRSGGPYWGGLQMDTSFMSTYGSDMLQKYHGQYADAWTPHDQMVVAQRGWFARGYQPWPQTSIMCNLR